MSLFESDTRLSFITKNKFRKVLYHAGIDPAEIKKVKCVIVFQEKDMAEDMVIRNNI